MPHQDHVAGRAPDAQLPHLLDISETFDFNDIRNRREDDLPAVASDNNLERLSGGNLYNLPDLLEAFDFGPTNTEEVIAFFQACPFRRAPLHHLADIGRRKRLTHDAEQPGQNDDSEQEIRERTSKHDSGALPDCLVVERYCLILLVLLFRLFGRHHVRTVFAEHLDVTAERDGAELPARSDLVGDAENFRSETNRKHFDPHLAPAGNEVMPHLVNKNEYGENQQERKNVVPN